MQKPSAEHLGAAKGVLRYLAGTKEKGLMYGAGPYKLEGYCDADYAGDLDTRRSTTGYVFVIGGGAICWQSKLQQTVALSTVEAEYMAASAATRQALWLQKLLDVFEFEPLPMPIYGDNQGAQALVRNPIIQQRSKHIDVLHHFVRERAERGEVKFVYVETARMLADALTKPVPQQKLVFCREGMVVI
ncbi:hypothetical protein GPECTOR_1030g305 [Gonium pectorale]|uniref:Reverse transcriptase Ty1/copia-type domain-containing protein n=1 Tax=Gonium pectorale TaxID=33097 RepID=A0A150FTQ8_GONPE|nr:hypothetical protein GPECTOR_1030g305 [Gonium pectorale]|eukprot:KXZ40994.1 hypothetical protein GPECTOR_1030g305 [Gonium pectorale]